MGARGQLTKHPERMGLRMTPALDYRLSLLEALYGLPRSVIVRSLLETGLDAITHSSTTGRKGNGSVTG